MTLLPASNVSSPSRTTRPSRLLNSLIGVPRIRVLAAPHLPALLVDNVLDPDLVRVLLLELADEARVPQLRRDAQVLAASQESIRLAAFAGRGYCFLGEVLAFAAGLGDEAIWLGIQLAIHPNTWKGGEGTEWM